MADRTQELEDLIDETVTAGREYMGEVVPRMSPRPVDTEKVGPADQQFDYDNRGADYWPKLAQTALQRAVTEGGNLGDAVIELLKHDERMGGSDVS